MARGASAAAMPMRKKPASMKNANPTMLLNLFRVGGRAWFCAMMAWMFFGLLLAAGFLNLFGFA